MSDDDKVVPIPVNLPKTGDMMELAEGFGDPPTLFASRQWLRAALEAKGAKITGGGVGMGQCDLDFTLEGCPFNVSLRPILRAENKGGD